MAGGLNRNIVIRLLADTSNYTAGLAKASADSTKLSTTMETSAGKTKLVTAGIAAAGVAATALGAAAINMAAEFDASMSTVQANTGASTDEMSKLRQAAIDAGASTVYSASESADAINELGKAGMTTSDILSGGLSGALNLAASDGMEVSEAAELMSSAMAQFNLTGKDATTIADALAAGAGKAQGNASDLGYALQQSGMVANSFGISMEETVGTLTSFAKAGMIGSDAGTSLKTMLIALAKPTDKAQTLMDELGINAYDAQGKFVGLSALAGQLQDSMGGLTQEQRNQALATIFGNDAIRAANVLYEQGADGISNWTSEVSDAGFAAEQAAAKNNNLKGDLENLSGSFESMMITIGEGGQGPLRSLVQTIDTLIDGFSKLPAPVQQGIVLFTALVGGSVALHSALKPLNSSTSGFAKNLGQLIDPGQRVTALASGVATAFQTWEVTFSGADKQIATFGTTISRSQGILSGFKSIGSGIINLMGGPWGIAIGLAATALISFTKKTQEAEQRADSLKTALSSTGDATEQIIENLSNIKIDNSPLIPDNIEQAYYGYEKLTDLLDDTGIKMSDMALAAQGNADAMNRITDVTNNMVASGGKQKDLAGIILSYLNEEKTNYQEASTAINDKTTAMEEANAATDTAATTLGDYSDVTEQTAKLTETLNEAIDGLVNTFLGMEGVNLNADKAITSFKQEILDCNEEITKNGRVLDQSGNALAGYESLAYSSQASLQNLASSAAETAQKILEQGQATGDMETATKQAGDVLQEAGEAFLRNADTAGMSAEAAQALATKYGLTRGKADELAKAIEEIPEKKELEIIANTDQAYLNIKSVGDAIAKLQNKEITVTQTMRYVSEYIQTGGQGKQQEEWHAPMKPAGATGGRFTGSMFLPGYATGGVVSGLVHGPGTGTSDSVHLLNARIANGEFVQSAAATKYYSPGFMSLLNERKVPRDMLMKAPQWIVQQNVQPSVETTKNVTVQFDQKIVRPADDMYVAASILHRNAAQLVGRLSR